jgi:hypothetical protein
MKRKIVGYHTDAENHWLPSSNADMGSTSAMILPGESGLGSEPQKGAQAD